MPECGFQKLYSKYGVRHCVLFDKQSHWPYFQGLKPYTYKYTSGNHRNDHQLSVAYSVVGIPLMLAVLNDVGSILLRCLTKIYNMCRRFYW
ncbi:unnamed protein product [Gongylonema pulchrum]|uniref:Transposase n=1 Tax=Gongylonema pulchrum TaxID=637853 RepID=A0A183DZJ0_9BILA|nr:unnamed protein product [Gongylonema pulchrum]